jgi:virginiamycin B lyase
MSRVGAALAAVLALLPLWPAADTEMRQGPGELAVTATIPRGGFSMEVGFDALWMMSDGRLVRVDTADNSVTDIELPGGDGPSLVAGMDQYRDLAVGEGGVWVPEMASSTIHKVDPSTGKVVLSIPSDMFGSIGSIGVGDGSVWVITFDNHNRTLTRYDADDGGVMAQVALPRPSVGVLYADDSVWVTAASAPELYWIDPQANELVATISIEAPTHILAAGAGALWLAFNNKGLVQRIDASTGAVVATIETGASDMVNDGDIAAGGGFVWVINRSSVIARVDPAGNTAAGLFRPPPGTIMGRRIRYGAESLWISGRSIFRVERPD